MSLLPPTQQIEDLSPGESSLAGYFERINSESDGHSITSRSSVSDDFDMAPRVTGPVGIVGMACRLPGADNPSQLWDNIVQQRDLQKKIPSDRFNVDAFYHADGANKGTTNAQFGYFLDRDISEFDPEFFKISGKEAEAIDPQQRMLLEVVYEALEDAGITLDQISGSRTSVYCGCFTNDYRDMLMRDLEHYPKHTVTGTGQSCLSNRISYFYNLHGPSITLDTACSSSLVGFHMAHQSIRNGECDVAIAVGSALHFDPNMFIEMTDMNFLSADGRCRAFDADGKGYARGEGICAVVLKRKDLAQLHGNTIRAAVCGTGSNHDGYKEGLTMPNTNAQESLISSVYKNAGLPTNETSYFEAHGTGTPAGDPREMRAIGAVFAPSRTNPLYVGSVKTNIGHLEGASGLAGVIKTTLSLEAAKILPNMHFSYPNPNIDFQKWKVVVPSRMLDWEPVNGVRRASINSFGYGGSNAHVILQAVKKDEEPLASFDASDPEEPRPFLLPMTSHTKMAGKVLKKDLGGFIERCWEVSVASLGRSLGDRGRSMHKFRSFVVGSDQDSILEDLSNPGQVWTRANDKQPRIGFVFTGQGAQWFAMGRQLIEQNAFFRQTLEHCDEILQDLANKPDWSCIAELLKTKEESRIDEFMLSSPLCCTIQIAIVNLLKQWAIEPVATVGHSSGEIPAAYAAGILSFEDAIICAYQRGYVLGMEVEGKCTVPGAMIAVGMTEEEAEAELRPYKGQACIAAANSYSSLTISGDEPVIVKIKESLEERKVFVRRLQVERAFHSHHMLPYASTLARLTADVTPRPATCRMVSSVTGEAIEGEEMTGTYFATNLTGKVRFADALTEMLVSERGDQAVDVLLEIGAHPALKGPSRHCYQSLKLEITYLATLDRTLPAFESLLSCAGQLFAHGYSVDLNSVNSNLAIDSEGIVIKTPAGRKVALPTYSWNHGKYWSETRLTRNHRLRKHRHSLLGVQLPGSTEKHPCWRRLLRLSELPWLSDHKIEGNVIFPAAGYLTMAIEAALRLESCPRDIKAISFRDVAIKSALALPDTPSGTELLLDLQPVTTSAKRSSDTWHKFSISSYSAAGVCLEHCHGSIEIKPSSATALDHVGTPLRDLRKRTDGRQSSQKYYSHLASIGLHYGEAFGLVNGDVECGSGFSMANVEYQQRDDCVLHPTFLDAALHPLFAGIETLLGRPLDEPFVPTFLKSMDVSGTFIASRTDYHMQQLCVCIETSLPGPRVALNDISVRSKDGTQKLIEFKGLEVTALGNGSGEDDQKRSLFFRTRWQPAFDCLSEGQEHLVSNLAQLMDLYAHQFPSSRILYLTSEVQAVRKILRHLGGSNGQRRRFQSLTPYSGNAVDDFNELMNEWPGLIDLSDPKAGDFDLVVMGSQPMEEVTKFLKPGGFVVSDGIQIKPQGLSKTFELGQMTAWRDQTDLDFFNEPLTIVTSDDTSDETEALISKIMAGHKGTLNGFALSDLPEEGLLSSNVIVLPNLDEDQSFGRGNDYGDENFAALKVLFENSPRKILWVTKGASMEASNPEQAMVLGLTRTARNENEKLNIVVVDVSKTATPQDISTHINQILSKPISEQEYTARENVLYIPRVEADDEMNGRLPVNSRGKTNSQSLGSSQPLALRIGKVGLLETLVFSEDHTITKTPLAKDEIEIEVRASAINFRDIAASVGIIDDYKLGDECAGIISKVGSACVGFEVGDRVVAWRPGQGAHRTIVRNPAMLCRKIGVIPFATAAALPLILTTAYYGLAHLARLEPGEHVLIHAAAGGVGQMAVQLAQMVGANVIATCGSHSKRELLKTTYGLKDSQILSSRDSSFVDGVLRLTSGKGVDVVLNSLAGDLLHATWDCVARFGRFIEIGKRDIHENGKLDMRQFRNNISFSSLDLITVFEHNRPLGARLLESSMKLVEEGKVRPPESILQLTYAEAEKGFRLLQMGKHTGKIVLMPHKEDVVPVSLPEFSSDKLFDGQKTYLIVGGLGGLARTLVEWMVRRGARSLAVMSRSGASSDKAKATVAWLKDRDIRVRVFAVDVTNYASVKESIDSLGSQLGGIFHAAMVLHDAPLTSMTHEQWQKCVDPKVLGAQHLHRATLHLDLDFFIPLSSVSATMGAMAQANYASANCYLDALVCHRRGLGLKASTINIGLIKGAGIVEGNDSLERKMIGMGSDQVTEDEFLYQVQEAVESGGAPAFDDRGSSRFQTITGINTTGKDYYWAKMSLFRNLYENHDIDGAGSNLKSTGSLSQRLQTASDLLERATILTSAFLDKLSAVLGIAKDQIQPSNSLAAYGLDSIVAVEIRKWFSSSVHVDLALFDILSAKSIVLLVEKAASMVLVEEGVTPRKAVKVEETKAMSKKISEQRPVVKRTETISRNRNEVWTEVKGANMKVHVMEISDGADGPVSGPMSPLAVREA